MIGPKATLALTAAALGGLILWACLRERTEAAKPPRPRRPAAATVRAEPAPPRTPEERPELVAARKVGAEMRRLQDRRQREWAVEVDRQTRLEWTERYDADRQSLLERLKPFAAGLPREILDDFDTWAAAQREYGKP